jgi:hypothetical protein
LPNASEKTAGVNKISRRLDGLRSRNIHPCQAIRPPVNSSHKVSSWRQAARLSLVRRFGIIPLQGKQM